jgi:hypothetical protein
MTRGVLPHKLLDLLNHRYVQKILMQQTTIWDFTLLTRYRPCSVANLAELSWKNSAPLGGGGCLN